MVGGVVIGLTRQPDRTHVNVADCPHYPKHGRGDECPRPDTCCVYTDEKRIDNGEAVRIAIGDSLWWQGGRCYWTPKANRKLPDDESKCGGTYDIAIKKIGYSH